MNLDASLSTTPTLQNNSVPDMLASPLVSSIFHLYLPLLQPQILPTLLVSRFLY